MAEIKNPKSLEDWLKALPAKAFRQTTIAMAMRAALRVQPFLHLALRTPPKTWDERRVAQDIVFPSRRAMAAPWLASLVPSLGAEVGDASAAAAAAVDDAAADAADAAAAARAAADASASALAFSRAAFASASASAAAAVDDAFADAAFGLVFAAAASAMWREIEADRQTFERSGIGALQAAPLWNETTMVFSVAGSTVASPFAAAMTGLSELNTRLATLGMDNPAWERWYNAVLTGWTRTDTDARAKAIYDGLDAATRKDGLKVIDALIEGLMGEVETARPPTVAEIASIASPTAIKTAENTLDATPNAETDKPVVDDDLPTLPIRQRANIGAILKGLGRQAPGSVREALQAYADELLARGVQPILGLIGDMEAIVAAGRAEPDADQWLTGALGEAFKRFDAVHKLLMTHFPLDKKREAIINRTRLTPEADRTATLEAQMAALTEAVKQANAKGEATADALKATQQQQQSMHIVVNMPQPAETSLGNKRVDFSLSKADRIEPNAELPGTKAKKRVLVMVGAFVLSIMGVAANIIQIWESATLKAVHEAAKALWETIKPMIGL